jgi:hypothetical protein
MRIWGSARFMILWLDDIRPPRIPGAVWVKTADEAIAALKTGKVEYASLDHDLSIDAVFGVLQEGEKTGYDVVLWMEENGVFPPDGVGVHSMNPVGKARMIAGIDRLYARS